MNWLDIVIIVAIAIPTFFGLRMGIIKAALSLAGIIVGVILAGRYYIPLSEQLTFIPQPTAAEIVAFAIILIGVMVISGVLATLLKRIASLVMLGWLNHLGGAVFGLLLGAIFCGALLTTWVNFFGVTEAITESYLAIILLEHFPVVLALLPEEFDVFF
ncbi:CvpA family protein [Dehalococcoidales bacterium]|nr:CvpA family protein [Dehalococcoidales bacterium]